MDPQVVWFPNARISGTPLRTVNQRKRYARSEPAGQFAGGDVGHGVEPGGMVVEAGNGEVIPTAGGVELFLSTDRDFLECFKTVGRKTRTHDGDPGAGRAQRFKRLIRVRLQPDLAAELRLIHELRRRVPQPERGRE